MGIYAQYSLLPFVPTTKKFKLLNGTQSVFNEGDAITIYNTLKESSNSFLRKAETQKLQTALNAAVKGNKEQYGKLIDKIITELDNTNFEQLKELGVAKRHRGTIKLDKNAAYKYENEVREIAKNLDGYTKEDTVEVMVSRLNGSLNKLRGDMFENFLAVTLDNCGSILSDLEETATEELIDSFSNTLVKMTRGNTKVIKSGNTGYKSKTARVAGDEIKDTLELLVDENKISIAGAQGKSDVIVEGLGNPAGISAKNYRSGSSTISLLGGARVAGLIAQWPGVSNDRKNLGLNGLSAVDLNASQFNLMKKIFLIQGLIGTENEDVKSQLFIVNKNTANNPFYVFSVYDLLFEDKNFEGDFKGSSITPIGIPRTPEDFNSFVQSARISIHTQLKINALAKL